MTIPAMAQIEEMKDGGYARADEVFAIPEAYRRRSNAGALAGRSRGENGGRVRRR